MAATVSEFVTLYPEFSAVDTTQVQAHLGLAENRIGPDFGDRRTEAVYLELATALADSSKGRPARRERGDTKQSVYEGRLKLLKFESSLGYRIA